MHSFARNWQLPFLNQRKEENDHRKYFMINLYKRMLLHTGIKPMTSWSPEGQASDWATKAGLFLHKNVYCGYSAEASRLDIKLICKQSPIPTMPLVKFDSDWPTGLISFSYFSTKTWSEALLMSTHIIRFYVEKWFWRRKKRLSGALDGFLYKSFSFTSISFLKKLGLG